MKTYIINKVGYSSGTHGCSNEYFHLVAIDGEKVLSTSFAGMYGTAARVLDLLRAENFKETYHNVHDFGKIPARDGKKFQGEKSAIQEVDSWLQNKA